MGQEVSEKGGAHDRARVVRRYLSALDSRKPGRTAARTVESLLHRIHQIDTLLLSADPVQRLHLTQERIDLHAEQLRLQTATAADFDELQKAFIRVAKAYGDRHDVTYSAWRQVGVDADVLAQAGVLPQAKPARPAKASADKPAAAPADTPAVDNVAASNAAASKPTAAAKPAAEPAADKPTAKKADPSADAASATPAAPKPAKKKQPAAPSAQAAEAKKAPATKKAVTSSNGSAPKKASAKKAAAPKPEQQQLPAEAHLLS